MNISILNPTRISLGEFLKREGAELRFRFNASTEHEFKWSAYPWKASYKSGETLFWHTGVGVKLLDAAQHLTGKLSSAKDLVYLSEQDIAEINAVQEKLT